MRVLDLANGSQLFFSGTNPTATHPTNMQRLTKPFVGRQSLTVETGVTVTFAVRIRKPRRHAGRKLLLYQYELSSIVFDFGMHFLAWPQVLPVCADTLTVSAPTDTWILGENPDANISNDGHGLGAGMNSARLTDAVRCSNSICLQIPANATKSDIRF